MSFPRPASEPDYFIIIIPAEATFRSRADQHLPAVLALWWIIPGPEWPTPHAATRPDATYSTSKT